MARIPTENELRKLYINKKQSLSEISKILGYKTHKVVYWMGKYKISRRGRSEANYIKANPEGEPFKIRTRLTRSEGELKYLALGLYWGEGNKLKGYDVKVANTDFGVIKQFKKFLIDICQVNENKIKYYLQTFKDNDVVLAKDYWAKKLEIDPIFISSGKPTPSLGNGSYKKFSKYGVMSICFYNTHLKAYIMNELGKLGLLR